MYNSIFSIPVSLDNVCPFVAVAGDSRVVSRRVASPSALSPLGDESLVILVRDNSLFQKFPDVIY